MIVKKLTFALFIVLLFNSRIDAQDVQFVTSNQLSADKQTTTTDTFPLLNIDEAELETISDIRGQLERQNKTYTTPAPPSENLLRFIQKDEFQFPPEALYLINWVRDPATVFGDDITFKDTIIVNPMFTPLLFKGGLMPDYSEIFDKSYLKKIFPQHLLYQPDTTLFADELLKRELEKKAYDYMRLNHPDYFSYSERDLPKDVLKAHAIKKVEYEPELIKIENVPTGFSDVDAPVKFIPERRYWTSHFQSSIQFAQNYISPNWHKGGVSALNLSNRQYFIYNYNRDKVQVTNELEWKTNLFTAPKDTLRDYKIGDDVLRLHSNFGYRAFNKWYYTFDATFQTQLFTNYQENTNNKLAAFLSPFSVNLGIGMKYDLNKSFPKNRHKKLTMSANLAPLSYTYMYSTNKHIDLGRHGFRKDEKTGEFQHKLSRFGSTINATLSFQFNRNINWYSRLYYFTSYENSLGEFENRLTMAISRFFSTTISVNIRFDDAAAKKEEFDSFFQINELLSFGFNYKW